MRPRYCRPEDRRKESLVFDRFVQSVAKNFPGVKWSIEGTPTDCDYDGVLLKDGKPYAFIEVKNRTGPGDRYETWAIAKDKIDRCKHTAAGHKVQFVLLMVWDGAIYGINGNAITGHVVKGGRWDREDPHDVENMIHIPAKLFTHFT